MENVQHESWLEVSEENVHQTAESLYWRKQGQHWRIMPEISQDRQSQLTQRLQIVGDIRKNVFPLKDVEPKLTRADIEWMLFYIENEGSEQTRRDHLKHKRLDLSGADLRTLDLSFLPLSHVRFGPHIYEWGQLTIEQQDSAGARLDDCNLYKTALRNTYLCGVHLERAHLRYAQLQGAHIRGATLSHAVLSHAHLERANLANARLQKADVRKASLQGADLNDAVLEGADFSEARLDGAELRNIKADGTNFRFAHFEKGDLSGSMLSNTYLHDAHLEQANLRRVHLEASNLTLARLDEADLTDAHLERANMSGAQCERAILVKAHFEDTDCRNANFAGAVLCQASFSQGTQLDNAIFTKEGTGPASFADIYWNNVNLAGMQVSSLDSLGDEKVLPPDPVSTPVRTKNTQIKYQEKWTAAIRAYRQFGSALQRQGMYEEANRFFYRSHVLKRKLLWNQGPRNTVPYILSLLIDMVNGYGYKLYRSLYFYVCFHVLWTVLYHVNAPHLSWRAAFLFSLLSFHGKILFEAPYRMGQEQLILVVVEAVIGTLFEILSIAVIVRRINKNR